MHLCETTLKGVSLLRSKSSTREERTYTIYLVGSANTGKSATFHRLTGAKAVVSNFPGTTVKFDEGTKKFDGKKLKISDTPGIYSLAGTSEEEKVTLRAIIEQRPDVIINIADSTRLEKCLPLFFQVTDFGVPTLIALNMADEAKGLKLDINTKRLSESLRVPVVPTVAVTGEGFNELLKTAFKEIPKKEIPSHPIRYDEETEAEIRKITKLLREKRVRTSIPLRTLAVWLLEGNEVIEKIVSKGILNQVKKSRQKLRDKFNEATDVHIEKRRYEVSERILSETVSAPRIRKTGWKHRLAGVTTHGKLSIPILVITMIALMLFFINVGAFFEKTIFRVGAEHISGVLSPAISGAIPGPLGGSLALGITRGLTAFLAIVIPYVLVFFILLALLEDTGYLARIAVLLDGALSKIGLYGKSIVPFMVGAGCNVTGVLGTRIIEEKKARVITAALVCLAIPCCGRIVVIFGFVSVFAGAMYVLAAILISVLMLVVMAKILTRVVPGEKVGLVIEVPKYRWPRVRNVLMKTYINILEFISIALPVMLVASITLAIAQTCGVVDALSGALAPFTMGWLGLPAIAIIPLIYCFFRREAGVAMFPVVAGGMVGVSAVMAPHQVLMFALLTSVPCISTVVALRQEFGVKFAFKVLLLTAFVWYLTVGLINQVITLIA